MSMSTQAKGFLLLVFVVAWASGAQGDTTWISNAASRGVVGTLSYNSQTKQFVNRLIRPGTSEKEDYSQSPVHAELWVEGAGQHNHVDIGSDRSLVAFDHGAGTTGVDIYQAKYGTLFEPEGDVLVTIFLNLS